MTRVDLLFVVPSLHVGGAERYAAAIAAAAAEAGHSVEIAVADRASQDLVQAMQDAGPPVRRAPVAMTRAVGKVGAGVALLRLITFVLRVRPRAIHLTLPHPNAAVPHMVAVALLNVRCLAVYQLVPSNLGAYSSRGRRLLRWVKSRRQRWVCVSQANARTLAQATGIEEIEVIPNGADFDAPPPWPRDRRDEFRRALGISAGASVLLTVARLDQTKGHRDIIHALPYVLAQHPETVCVWAGDGPQREELRALCEERGVGDAVRMLGTRDDIPSLLSVADAFVLPTREEGQPFAVMEAMAKGVPLIVGPGGGVPELVRDGRDGWIVRREDACHLQELLVRFLDAPAEAHVQAESAKLRVAEFDSLTMKRSTVMALKAILECE